MSVDPLARSSLAPVRSQSGAVYLRHALGHPLSLAFLLVGMALCGLSASVIGVASVLLAQVGFVVVATRSEVFRRAVDREVASDRVHARDAQREARIQQANPVHRERFVELAAVVADVERTDTGQAARFELQGLLDHFIGLAVLHQRCLEAIARADRAQLARQLEEGRAAAAGAAAPSTRRRLEIVEHRIRLFDAHRRRADEIGEELLAIAEFVHLVGQRTACPFEDPELDRELERRMWDLDAEEQAYRQLSSSSIAA